MPDNPEPMIAMVQRFIALSMASDPAAEAMLAPGFTLVFTGGRRFARPGEIGAFNATRYARVAKRIHRWDVSQTADETVVTCTGELYGAWPDGTAFDGNRFLDRFLLKGGLIVRMDVWNDSAEWILDGHRAAPPT